MWMVVCVMYSIMYMSPFVFSVSVFYCTTVNTDVAYYYELVSVQLDISPSMLFTYHDINTGRQYNADLWTL